MPACLAQRFRLGEISYDHSLHCRVFNHVFEVVDDTSSSSKDKDKELHVGRGGAGAVADH